MICHINLSKNFLLFRYKMISRWSKIKYTDILDPCNPDPCQNGGMCKSELGKFSCTCNGGWTGPTCGKCQYHSCCIANDGRILCFNDITVQSEICQSKFDLNVHTTSWILLDLMKCGGLKETTCFSWMNRVLLQFDNHSNGWFETTTKTANSIWPQFINMYQTNMKGIKRMFMEKLGSEWQSQFLGFPNY